MTFRFSEAAKWALKYRDVVVGFVGQSPLAEGDDPGFIQFTPGVSLTSTNDAKGQQYSSPADAVVKRGADVIIVGRGLILNPDLLGTAEQYREQGWKAFTGRVQI